jgi:hypothetical protein
VVIIRMVFEVSIMRWWVVTGCAINVGLKTSFHPPWQTKEEPGDRLFFKQAHYMRQVRMSVTMIPLAPILLRLSMI